MNLTDEQIAVIQRDADLGYEHVATREQVLALVAEVRASRAAGSSDPRPAPSGHADDPGALVRWLYDEHRALARAKVTGGLTSYGEGRIEAIRQALDEHEKAVRSLATGGGKGTKGGR